MKLLTRILSAFVLLAAAAGCRDTSGPDRVNPTLYDIVCLRSIDTDGSTFTLTMPEGNNVITYYASELVDTAIVPVGNRLMLAYRAAEASKPYTTGSITAIGYSLIYNDVLRGGTIDSFPEWERDPVYLLSAWMSEDFLNLRARLTFDTKPRRLFVMIDTLTVEEPYPTCYLVHQLSEPLENFDRAYYISVDMSALRKLAGCRGFRLLLHDSNLDLDSLTFELKDFKQ